MHHERRNMNENNSNDLQTIITQVIEEMKSEQGDKFDPNKINLVSILCLKSQTCKVMEI